MKTDASFEEPTSRAASTVLILTGASGAGKTAIATALEQMTPAVARVHYFDSIGVPSSDAMISRWGSGEKWQYVMTAQWLARIQGEVSSTDLPVVLEGQMQLSFIRAALDATPLSNVRVILVDCDDAIRAHRLIECRNQPDLANSTMMRWAAHLRDEALTGGVEILDTSTTSVQEAAKYLCKVLGYSQSP